MSKGQLRILVKWGFKKYPSQINSIVIILIEAAYYFIKKLIVNFKNLQVGRWKCGDVGALSYGSMGLRKYPKVGSSVR